MNMVCKKIVFFLSQSLASPSKTLLSHAGHVYVRLGLSDNFLMTSSECSGHHVQNVQNPYIFPIFIKRIKLLFLADVKVFTYAKDILRSKSNI